MANIIAIVWDFDKTLVDGYMQEPIFEDYNIDSKRFWSEVNDLPRLYKSQGVKVNADTIYLNHFIHYVRDGKMKGLNNAKLEEYGKKLRFYKGIPEIFAKTKELVQQNPIYSEYDIKVEHYVVSTGMSAIIKGSGIMKYISGVWGCELIEDTDDEGNKFISEIGYTIDNTTKTRALFEINKGVGMDKDIEVNSTIPEEYRRVHFINMIYVADGPSDIPAFSVVNKNGGATFAIYPRGDKKAMRQVERMREDGRINMYAEADYSEGTTAYMWLCNKVEEMADRIREDQRAQFNKAVSSVVPKHLTD